MADSQLINFLENTEFNQLRLEMGGAKLVPPIPSPDIKKLKEKGVDIGDLNSVIDGDDGTLSYKNKRVLVYIRDVIENNDQQFIPKFHISSCSKLDEMKKMKRFGRYVVYNGEDTNFVVNFIGTTTRSTILKLNVCKYCLALLKWDNYSTKLSEQEKNAIVDRFKLTDFFAKYPRDLFTERPDNPYGIAPIDDYSEDWG